MNWKDVFTAPNAITLGNLVLGFLALLAVSHGAHRLSASLILVAVLVDASDGVVARRLSKASTFGREFDSLADLVSFGVAPAMLVYSVFFTHQLFAGLAVASAYLVAGAARLARFNVAGSSKDFSGLPIPAAGGLLASITFPLIALSPWVVALIVACLCALMVGCARYPKLRGSLSHRENQRLLAVLAAGGLIALADFRLLFAPFMAYVLYGIFLDIAQTPP